MNPEDLDGEDGGLSFNELPPSVRQRMQGPQTAAQPAYQPAPRHVPQVPPQAMQYAAPAHAPQAQMPQMQGLVPVGQAGQGQIYKPAPDGTPKDNSMLLFLGATALLAGVGYWAYSKMEKEKKGRLGPPQLGEGRYRYDGPEEGYDDDPQSGGPLDAYEDVGLPPRAVDRHEKGGIKLVKG